MKLKDLQGEDPEICLCKHITRSQMEAAIMNGAHTVKDLQEATIAGHGCGGCRELMQELIDLMLAEAE